MDASTEIAARRFLKNGQLGGHCEEDMAAWCSMLIQDAARRSLKTAAALAHRFVRRADGRGRILRLAAYRALARVSHLGGNHNEALRMYLAARRLCRSDRLLRARIDRALIDVYMYLGKTRQALACGASATAAFGALHAEDDVVQTKVNLANVYHRQDRHEDAELLYREAEAHFLRRRNELAAARCMYNRANTLVQLFDMDTAEKLYFRAAGIYEKDGRVLEACDARYGLAWLWMLTGQFHVALRELSTCEKTYREGGERHGEALCILDRAEVYLALGLNSDALSAARQADRKFGALKLRYEQSKAYLFQGQAALGLGRRSNAGIMLAKAERGFRLERNIGFLGAAHLLGAEMRAPLRGPMEVKIQAARRCFVRAQLPYWEAMCDLTEAITLHRDEPLKRLARKPVTRWVPHLYSYCQTALGDRAFAAGRRQTARRHWRLAAERLDSVRVQLPPVDMRGAYSRRIHLPHPRLVATAWQTEPPVAAVWAERNRTAGLWAPIAPADDSSGSRQAVEKSLNALSAHVASLLQRSSSQETVRRSASAGHGATMIRLQRQIREGMAVLEDGSAPAPEALEKLQAHFKSVARRLPVIQIHVQDNDLLLFRHYNNDTSVRRLSGGRQRLDEFMLKWRFVLESQLLANKAGATGAFSLEYDVWSELGTWLWRPLEIPDSVKRVLILPEGESANLPWPALIVDGAPLDERHRFILAPSLRHYLAAHKVVTESQTVRIFGGLSGGIPHARREVRALRRVVRGPLCYHASSRRDDWPMQGEDHIWHFSGHANVRADNPFYSYLLLEDGPLFAADFRLRRCLVNLVSLAACRSGEELALPGDESTGLVRSLLEMGARNVVAGRWPVSDESAALWMSSFYTHLYSGRDLLEAAAAASAAVRRRYPSAYHWAAFAVYGAGNLRGHHVCEKN